MSRELERIRRIESIVKSNVELLESDVGREVIEELDDWRSEIEETEQVDETDAKNIWNLKTDLKRLEQLAGIKPLPKLKTFDQLAKTQPARGLPRRLRKS